MQLVVGLGNPGGQYQRQRHNIGFILLDQHALEKGYVWEDQAKFNSLFIKDEDRIFLKPQTYMNNSGSAVSKVLSFYKIEPKDLVVIHDDLDLDFGRIKKVFDSDSAGHHGVEDIIEKIGTKEFTRLRVGIGRPRLKEQVNDYVLSDFSHEELTEIIKLDIFSLLL